MREKMKYEFTEEIYTANIKNNKSGVIFLGIISVILCENLSEFFFFPVFMCDVPPACI